MNAPGQFGLLGQRRFLPFFTAQALGAFNDNAYRNVLIILVTFGAASSIDWQPELLANVAAALFTLPYLVLSGIAGQLADRYAKSSVLKVTKACEVAIMAIATWGLLVESAPVLLIALLLLGVQSAFFAPAKYGILPQVLDETELVGGNALLEMGTFLAILLGTLCAGIMAAHADAATIGLALIAIAGLGFGVSLMIPRTAAIAATLAIDWNPWRSTWQSIRAARESTTVWLAVLGNSWFWAYGAIVLAQLPIYTKTFLGGTQDVVTVMLVAFSTGVGIGSLLCERLSGRKVEIGLVPFGSIGLTVFAIDLFFASPGASAGAAVGVRAFLDEPYGWRVLADITLLGIFGGFYIVPLYAVIQQRARAEVLSQVIGANNIVNSLLMVAGASFAAIALTNGLTVPQLLLTLGLMNAAVAVFIYTVVPEFLLRFLAWLLIHSLYRLRINGIDSIPAEGAALLICNHVSFVDAIVIAAACRRPVRFVMDAAIYHTAGLNAVFRGMKAVPVVAKHVDETLYERAFATVAQELAAGNLVCIFPEGRLTSDGAVGEFRPGMLRILAETPVPVVPMALSGLWGSMFSRASKSVWKRLPRKLFARISLAVGPCVPPDRAVLNELRDRVLGLRGANA
jgi:1-acyl-sn-glycerol-3-phosphate acyltransferase